MIETTTAIFLFLMACVLALVLFFTFWIGVAWMAMKIIHAVLQIRGGYTSSGRIRL